jgi:hypothetical protein
MRVAKYLDELQRALSVKTDKDVAAKMGWTHSVPSNWRKGRSYMTNQTAGQISAVLNVPVMHIIAAVEADREEMTGQRSFWTDFFLRTTGVSAVVALAVVTNFVTPSPAQAHQLDASPGSSLSYVKLSPHSSRRPPPLDGLFRRRCSPSVITITIAGQS